MTKREFYEAIVTGTVTEEMQAMAADFIEKMNAQNAARREKVTAKQAENAVLVEKVVEMLGTEPLTATDIASNLVHHPIIPLAILPCGKKHAFPTYENVVTYEPKHPNKNSQKCRKIL